MDFHNNFIKTSLLPFHKNVFLLNVSFPFESGRTVVTGPRLPRLDQRPFLELLSEKTGELEIEGCPKLWVL